MCFTKWKALQELQRNCFISNNINVDVKWKLICITREAFYESYMLDILQMYTILLQNLLSFIDLWNRFQVSCVESINAWFFLNHLPARMRMTFLCCWNIFCHLCMRFDRFFCTEISWIIQRFALPIIILIWFSSYNHGKKNYNIHWDQYFRK